MAKLLLILFFGWALIDEMASSKSEPPLLIDASNSTPNG